LDATNIRHEFGKFFTIKEEYSSQVRMKKNPFTSSTMRIPDPIRADIQERVRQFYTGENTQTQADRIAELEALVIAQAKKIAQLESSSALTTVHPRVCKGVSFHKTLRRWQVRITIDGKRKSLGYYDTQEEAIQAYSNAAKERDENGTN